MKTIILAGGYGTRLAELTDVIPKPMVPIGGKPILWHIMSHYEKYGHRDFYLALGYKAEVIKDFFLRFHSLSSDFRVNLETGVVDSYTTDSPNWNVSLINTGVDSMTGGRVKRMKELIKNETFLLTYGDGLSNIDIAKLVEFHKSHGKLVTVSAVRPTARFGELVLDGDVVSSFQEKPQLYEGWINGGFFVVEPQFFDLIDSDQTMLEREPLERASTMGELMAYRHDGFWHCMDTKRDHDLLESMWSSGNAPWVIGAK